MTPGAYLGRLAGPIRPIDAQRLLYEMGNELTPLEVAGVLRGLRRLEGELGRIVRRSGLLGSLEREYPQPYRRTDLGEGIRFYSSRRGRRRDKCLLINFGSVHGHTLVHVSGFLQHLPADRFDVVVLSDPHRLTFRRGFGRLDMALPLAVRRLGEALDAGGYGRVVTMGHSMGGIPALSAARTMRASKGISLGGVFPWDVNTLLDGDRLDAFLPLCACLPAEGPELVAVYAEGHARDRQHAELARRIAGATPLALAVRNHNVLVALAQQRRIRRFLAEMLDFRPRPARRPPRDAGLLRRLRHQAGRRLRQVLGWRPGADREYGFLDRAGRLD